MKSVWLAVLLLSLGSTSGYSIDRYYMSVFGVQDSLNRFTTAHTFGVFVHAKEEGDDPAQYPLNIRVISWLPASEKVYLFKKAEPGRNHLLEESLSVPAKEGRSIAQWGPVEIKKELFDRASVQVTALNQKKILYKAYDQGPRQKGIATNCEHAVSDIDTDHGLLPTGTAHGFRGSRMVALHLRRWVLGPLEHPELIWLEKRLGLTQFPIRKGHW